MKNKSIITISLSTNILICILIGLMYKGFQWDNFISGFVVLLMWISIFSFLLNLLNSYNFYIKSLKWNISTSKKILFTVFPWAILFFKKLKEKIYSEDLNFKKNKYSSQIIKNLIFYPLLISSIISAIISTTIIMDGFDSLNRELNNNYKSFVKVATSLLYQFWFTFNILMSLIVILWSIFSNFNPIYKDNKEEETFKVKLLKIFFPFIIYVKLHQNY